VSRESEERNKLKSDVLNAALLREIGDRLLALQDHFRESSTEGFAEPHEPVLVTAAGVTVEPHTKHWFAVEVMNDGPNNVEVLIMSPASSQQWTRPRALLPFWHTVLPTETYIITFTKGQIKNVQMRTAAGETASVRLVGVR